MSLIEGSSLMQVIPVKGKTRWNSFSN